MNQLIKNILIFLSVVFVLIIAAFLIFTFYFLPKKNGVSCTQEAKFCPDGSYVGRIPPKCDFAPCPSTDSTSSPQASSGQIPSAKQVINLFYYNQIRDIEISGDISCSREAVAPVKREVVLSRTPIQDAINLLLKGNLTEEEKNSGFATEFPLEGLRLTGADLKNSVLTLSFVDPLNKTSGGSCRVGILWSQIEKTAKQFPGVREVKFQPEWLFQP